PVVEIPRQLAAGGGDVVPPGGAHGDRVPRPVEDVPEAVQGIVGNPLVAGIGKRVEGDQVDLAGQVAEQYRQFLGVLGAIVDLVDEGVLDGHLAVGVGQLVEVAPGGGDQGLHRILAVDRHQLVAQGVIGGVEGDCQGHVG